MKIGIRVDSSIEIGTGHFIRCLSLANELQQRNVQVYFICRHLPEYLCQLLKEKKHELIVLNNTVNQIELNELSHSCWLGVTQEVDADSTIKALDNQVLDWLIVDHYALDFRWEKKIRAIAKKILVIDDIADRIHDCDILLDQNFYIDMAVRYAGKVPNHCRLLLGPRYALIRQEFRQKRQHVKPRSGIVKRIFVFMGGVDAENYTAEVIRALSNIGISNLYVDVVIGALHPYLKEIKLMCAMQNYSCHVQTDQMAELMACADLAIGAGGSTTWERCCLGLPTLCLSMAMNQIEIASNLHQYGVLRYLGSINNVNSDELSTEIELIIQQPENLARMSAESLKLVDGYGIVRVYESLAET